MWNLERSGLRQLSIVHFRSFDHDLGTPEKWWGEDIHGIYLSPTKVHDHLLLRGVRIADSKS